MKDAISKINSTIDVINNILKKKIEKPQLNIYDNQIKFSENIKISRLSINIDYKKQSNLDFKEMDKLLQVFKYYAIPKVNTKKINSFNLKFKPCSTTL